MSSTTKGQFSSYRTVTDNWRVSGVSNIEVPTKRRIAAVKFLDLPAEPRLIIYRIFFGMPTLVDPASAYWEGQASILGMPLHPRNRNNDNELTNLLLVSKDVYKQAAPELYRVAHVVAKPRKIIAMVLCANRIACSQALSPLALKDQINPENHIRALTIMSRCGVSDVRNHKAKAHAHAVDKLITAILLLRTHFPRLEDLVVQVSHYQDLISGGAVIRFVSPLCCLSRLKSIHVRAEDVGDRGRAVAAGKHINGASRLRIETAVLTVLGDIFTENNENVPESQRLHKDGKCVYQGPNAGVQLQRKVLAPLLKKKYWVTLAKLR